MNDPEERRPGFRAILLTAMFYPLMFAWTVAGIAAAPFLIAILKAATGWDTDRVVRFWVKVHGKGLIAIVSPFARLRKENLETIPLPSVLVVNHLSFVDGYFMAALPFFDMTFAVGAWPFRMYWYTAFMRMSRYIDVENTPWETVVKECRRVAERGGCVLFFPEGHRSPDGRLQPFHSGAFRLAIETGLPLVPLVISGTRLLLPKGCRWFHPAEIRLKALPAMDSTAYRGMSGPSRLSTEVRRRMEEELQSIRRPAKPGGRGGGNP